MFPLRSHVTSAILAGCLLTLAMPVFAAEHGAPHWSYSGEDTGPAKWGSLETDFATCKLGKDQSPIDIPAAALQKSDLPPIAFDYKPTPLRIIDNGHSIQIDYAPGSHITVGGHQYELVQFHFHKPSEEKMNSKNYDMVAHLVHKDQDGKLAVVAVLLSKGGNNPLLDTLWHNLPKQKGHEINVDNVKINAADLLPQNRAYYTFAGSLTTPPCSESVTWFVLQDPAPISADELARFARLYPMNARPVQPLNGRVIQASR